MTRYAINVIENGENQLLFLQRSPHAKLGPGLWGFSGGHIEASESPEQCSLREIGEELGSEHRIELLAKLGPVKDSFYGGVMEICLFHYRWHAGHIALNEEHTRYAWISREDYRNYPVMAGIDEDIAYFNIWPRSFLNQDKLPPAG
jgi:8-oxo-dGTP pyrophosphatase MutT (NUDIX family)